MQTPTYLLSSNFLTIFVGNVHRQINSKDNRYSKAIAFIKARDWKNLMELLDQPAALAKYSDGKLQVYDNEVHYDGQLVRSTESQKILEFMKQGLPIEPLCRYLNNVYMNTDVNVRERLYKFIENNNLAITERGSFLVFKLVKENGTPYYSHGQLQNEKGEWIDAVYKIGETYYYDKKRIVKSSNECSTEGIYVGNKTYWNQGFDEQDRYTGDGRMLIAEVYPQDVENVPHADCTKIVVSKLKIVDEYVNVRERALKPLWSDKEPVDSKPIPFDVDTKLMTGKIKLPIKTPPRRDSSGRFIKVNKKVTIKTHSKRDARGRFIKAKSKR